MPMQELPTMTSNRPKSAWEQYMAGAAPPAQTTTALGSVRSAALGSSGQSAGSSAPALRQANTPGPAETTQGDLDSTNSQYAAWFARQKANGLSDQQIAALPEFQAWQGRVTSAAGKINNVGLADQNVNALHESAYTGNPAFKDSQLKMRDAFFNRKTELTSPAPTSPATPSPNTGAARVPPNARDMIAARLSQMGSGTRPLSKISSAAPKTPNQQAQEPIVDDARSNV